MPKEEWGVKRVCPTTGKRFYDLGRTPIVSPYTGEVVNIESPSKSRVALKDEKKVKQPAGAVDDDDDLIDDDSVLEDDDVDLGDDVLDEDDDDDNMSLDDIADVGGDDDDN